MPKNDTTVNGLSPVTKVSDGTVIAFPDVCKTPVGSAIIPIPYPNISKSGDLAKGSKSVKINGAPVCLSSSEFSTSTGDEAGSAKGMASGTTKGKAFPVNYSFDVKIEGKNVVRNGDPFIGNNRNTPPTPIMQSQPVPVAMTGVASEEDEEKEDEEKNIISPLVLTYSGLRLRVHPWQCLPTQHGADESVSVDLLIMNTDTKNAVDGPNDSIGHAFISLEYPEGVKITRGFWPKKGFDLGEKSDRKGVIFGMDGILDDDTEYLHKTTGLNATKTFKINESQAKKALKIINLYEDNPPKYRILTNQCTVFALKVLRSTGNNVKAGVPSRPTLLYETLSGKKL